MISLNNYEASAAQSQSIPESEPVVQFHARVGRIRARKRLKSRFCSKKIGG
jgi:hypothetical protein